MIKIFDNWIIGFYIYKGFFRFRIDMFGYRVSLSIRQCPGSWLHFFGLFSISFNPSVGIFIFHIRKPFKFYRIKYGWGKSFENG
jgi:hypothetical protein